MKLNLEVLQTCGTFILWLGVALGIVGIVLFVASSGDIGFSVITTHTRDEGSIASSKSIACGTMSFGYLQRMAFILPAIAGLILVISGYYIRDAVNRIKTKAVSSNMTIYS